MYYSFWFLDLFYCIWELTFRKWLEEYQVTYPAKEVADAKHKVIRENIKYINWLNDAHK
mgnify:CR=1 FL=1